MWLVNRGGLILTLAYGVERNGRGFRRGDSRWVCCFDLSFP
ncbi:hypothetical protein [Orenia metallireducens]|nr:hypothetical protein [Orenia metallireducens]